MHMFIAFAPAHAALAQAVPTWVGALHTPKLIVSSARHMP